MLNDLQNIARSIDTLLLNDPYPETVKPDYLRRAVRDYPVRGGKRLRPALVIWCCELLGGSREQALYPAAAAEVYHNWTLVHDDIIDRQREEILREVFEEDDYEDEDYDDDEDEGFTMTL